MTFKTYREARLERLLGKFTALDDGDEPYWYDRRDLIDAALDELRLRNAAPQAGKTRTAPTIAEEHPEKPAVAVPALAETFSLRDYFAANAMADVLRSFNWSEDQIQKGAAMCYRLADAMLAEREKK